MFRALTPSLSSLCADGLVEQILSTRMFGPTKPLAHPEDGNGVSVRNIGKTLCIDAAVCPRKFYWAP